MSWDILLAVCISGALGSVLRYWLARRWPATSGRIPLGILVANLSGSALAGVFFASSRLGMVPGSWTVFLIAGFCGGLSTFSTWAIDTVLAGEAGGRRLAVRNILWNIAGSVLAFAVMLLVTMWIAAALFAVILDGR